MIRFISFLLGREYEECKSCQTLKEQLAVVNEEKKQLTETLINIFKPKVYENPPIELQSTLATANTFSKRRAALEAASREQAKLLKTSKVIGRPDSELNQVTMNNKAIEELEQELGISKTGEV